jgi:hypothetical protein
MSYLGIRDQFLDAYGGENRKSIKLGINNIFNNIDQYSLQDLNKILDTGKKPKKNDFGYSSGVLTGSPFDEAGYNAATSNFNSLYSSIGQMFIDQKGLFGTGDGDGDKPEKAKDTGTVEGTGKLYDTGQETREIAEIKPIAPIAPVSVRDQVGPDYTPRSSGKGVAGLENIAAAYGAGVHLGDSAIGAAIRAGYTTEDIRRAADSGRLPNALDGSPLQIMGGARDVVYGNQISEIFGPGRGPDHQNRTMFGHEDYTVNRMRGFSDLAIKEYLDRNMGKLASNNRPGSGGLYDEIVRRLPKAIPGVPGVPGVAAKSLLIGGSRIGSGAYAQGVQANRSDAYTSGRSTMGTSQYRR